MRILGWALSGASGEITASSAFKIGSTVALGVIYQGQLYYSTSDGGIWSDSLLVGAASSFQMVRAANGDLFFLLQTDRDTPRRKHWHAGAKPLIIGSQADGVGILHAVALDCSN